MIRIFTVVGARPQFIKAAAISRTLRLHYGGRAEETLVHTGQHYDDNMSDVFFREMEIPAPGYHLGIGSGKHGAQTGAMMAAMEEVLAKERPDVLLVYGDTNSTLAAALAAAKMHIPVAHVEAGLRSFRKTMPEEINRRLCDHISTFLFSPTDAGVANLAAEGIVHHDEPLSSDRPLVINAGDVMLDNALYFSEKTVSMPETAAGPFLLCTVHRDFNTDDPQRLEAILRAVLEAARLYQVRVVMPLHPRTSAILSQPQHAALHRDMQDEKLLEVIPPVSYLQTLALLRNARMVLTDSGGLQKEAYFFGKNCVILREETEWSEIVDTGNAVCANANPVKILQAVSRFMSSSNMPFPQLYGDGRAAEKIIDQLILHLSR